MRPRIHVNTSRLELIAGNRETVRAEISDRVMLANLLNASVPEDWPPEMNDLQMKELSVHWFEEHPYAEGWLCWYFVLRRRRILIGIGGFKDKPEADGTVEIGYSILKRFQGRGYATEATGALIAWAFSHARVRRVLAETARDSESSIRVLEKCGFKRLNLLTDQQNIWFERTKS